MPEYRCECCNYVTNKKSTFDTHNVSKKHLEKFNGSDVKSEKSINMETIYSQKSNVSNDNYLTLKIRELENALKLKDLELHSLKNENENLKQLLKSKDETIDILKQKSAEPQLVVSQKVVKPIPISQRKENIVMKIAEPNNPEALNIELFLDNIQKSNETYYTQKVEYFGHKVQLLKPRFIECFAEDFTEMAWKLVDTELNKLATNQRPFYLVNKRLHKFSIKSNGVWYSPNDRVMPHKADEILELFFKEVRNFIHKSYINIKKPVKYYDDKTEVDEAYQKMEDGKSLYAKISAKVQFGEEISSREKYIYNLVNRRNERLRALKDYTGFKKDFDTFYDSIAKHIDDSLSSAKYNTFVIRLANNGKNATEANKTSTKKHIEETENETENENEEQSDDEY